MKVLNPIERTAQNLLDELYDTKLIAETRTNLVSQTPMFTIHKSSAGSYNTQQLELDLL